MTVPPAAASIGKTAIKMACLQVNPGSETKVAEIIKNYCNDPETDIEDYAILKGFGNYDLILFYQVNDFEFHLSKAGPIPGIISSITFLCFPYLGSNSSDIFKMLKNEIFLGISFIKYNEKISNDLTNSENAIKQFFNLDADTHFLGTLGFNEVIAIIGNKNIDTISSNILRLNYDHSIDKYIDKTFSTFCVNFEIISSIDEKIFSSKDIEISINKLESHFNEYSELKESISYESLPCISISSPSRTFKLIKQYWSNREFELHELIGHYDICLSLTKKSELSWSRFFAYLIVFRWSYKKHINSTNTTIQIISNEENNVPPLKENNIEEHNIEEIPPFEYSEVEKLLGEAAPIYVNHWYSLNALLQDPVKNKAFDDMKDFPYRLIETLKVLSASPEHEKDVSKTAFQATNGISTGIQLRSYGLLGNVNTNQGSFSKLRGGMQRAVLAVEYLPAIIFNRLKLFWYGYINVEDPKFSTMDQIIYIPTQALWQPDLWWAIYHETGHLLLSKDLDIIKNDVACIKEILVNKKDRDKWFDFLIELAAEIVGFQLGFFLDFDLYFNLLFDHLSKIEPLQKYFVSNDLYLFRTFFVKMFSECFLKNNILKNKLTDETFLFQEAYNLIENAAKKYPELFKFIDEHFLAAQFMITQKNLFHFSSYLNEELKKFEKQHDSIMPPDKRNDPEVKKMFDDYLLEGYVWPGDINFPESLIYKILTNKSKMEFNSNIATIISFWNNSLKS